MAGLRPVGCMETPRISGQGWVLAVECGRRNRKQSFFLLGLGYGAIATLGPLLMGTS